MNGKKAKALRRAVARATGASMTEPGALMPRQVRMARPGERTRFSLAQVNDAGDKVMRPVVMEPQRLDPDGFRARAKRAKKTWGDRKWKRP